MINPGSPPIIYVAASESFMRMPKPLNTELPISQRIAKVVSEMTSIVAVPAYFEPFGLVPATSYFGASISVSARAATASASKQNNAKTVRIMVSSLAFSQSERCERCSCQASGQKWQLARTFFQARQLLPHLADLGPGVVLEALFQIQNGKVVAAPGAGEPLPGDRRRHRRAGA